MKTTSIYACYLPGSTLPDYIGSHNSTPPPRNPALKWRYANCTYLGQGAWRDPDGKIEIPRQNHATLWARTLLDMSPQDCLAIRVETLSTVDASQRWAAEAEAIRAYKPPFNALLPQTANQRRLKHNDYHRAYRQGYYARNPAKLEAKRKQDRERKQAQRAGLLPRFIRDDPED